MPEWLSDEELDAIARTFADECDVEKLLAQAREANRLRAGLSALKVDILARVLTEESWPPLETVERIGELLEGGE